MIDLKGFVPCSEAARQFNAQPKKLAKLAVEDGLIDWRVADDRCLWLRFADVAALVREGAAA